MSQSSSAGPLLDLSKNNSILELYFSCENLARKDLLSKSDPMLIAYKGYYNVEARQMHWKEIGRTEALNNNKNPVFCTQVSIPFYGIENARHQKLRFEVYDVDAAQGSLSGADQIGMYQTTLAELYEKRFVKAPMQRRARRLYNFITQTKQATRTREQMFYNIENLQEPYMDIELPKTKEGSSIIKIRCVPVSGGNVHTVRMHLTGKDFPRGRNKLDVADPYLIVSKYIGDPNATLNDVVKKPEDYGAPTDGGNEDSKWLDVYRTETIPNQDDPQWQPFQIPLSRLTSATGSIDTPVKFSVFDYNSRRADRFICAVTTSVRYMIQCHTKGRRVVFPPLKKNGKRNRSYIHLHTFFPEQRFSFSNFVNGGMKTKVSVAIDFSKSNGDDPLKNPRSHHHRNADGSLNQYEQALTAIAQWCEKHEMEMSLMGFGARVKGVRSNCFSLPPNAAKSTTEPSHMSGTTPLGDKFASFNALSSLTTDRFLRVMLGEDESGKEFFKKIKVNSPKDLSRWQAAVAHRLRNDFSHKSSLHPANVDHVLSVYRETLEQIELDGSSSLRDCLDAVMKNSEVDALEWSTTNQVWHVVVVLTDAMFNDHRDIILKLRSAMALPMSVVFASVGTEGRNLMHLEDLTSRPAGKQQPKRLSYTAGLNTEKQLENLMRGQDEFFSGHDLMELPAMMRDCVHQISVQGYNGNIDRIRVELLKEIPEHVETYCAHRKTKPGKDYSGKMSDIDTILHELAEKEYHNEDLG